MKSVRAQETAIDSDTATAVAAAAPQGVGVPRKVSARYPIATIGSRTRRGGEVVLASQGEPAGSQRATS